MPKGFSHSESFLKIAYEHISDTIVVTDHKKNITYLNPAAVVLTGKNLKKSKGKNVLK